MKRVVSADTAREETANKMIAKSCRDRWLWESRLLAMKRFLIVSTLAWCQLCSRKMEFPPHFFVIKKVSTKIKQKTPHKYYSSPTSVLSRKNPPAWNLLRQVGTVFLPPVTRHPKEVKHFIWNTAQATALLAAVSNNFAGGARSPNTVKIQVLL